MLQCGLCSCPPRSYRHIQMLCLRRQQTLCSAAQVEAVRLAVTAFSDHRDKRLSKLHLQHLFWIDLVASRCTSAIDLCLYIR